MTHSIGRQSKMYQFSCDSIRFRNATSIVQNSVRQNDKWKFVSPLRSTNEKLIMINYFWNVKHVAYNDWIVSTVCKASDTLNKSIIDVTRTLEKQINCAWSTFIVCKMRHHLKFIEWKQEKRKRWIVHQMRSGAQTRRKKNPIKYIDGFVKIYRLSWKRSTSIWEEEKKIVENEREKAEYCCHTCLFIHIYDQRSDVFNIICVMCLVFGIFLADFSLLSYTCFIKMISYFRMIFIFEKENRNHLLVQKYVDDHSYHVTASVEMKIPQQCVHWSSDEPTRNSLSIFVLITNFAPFHRDVLKSLAAETHVSMTLSCFPHYF